MVRVSLTLRKLLRCGCLPLLLIGLALPRASHAQISIYAEGSASDLQGGPAGDYLYGGTAGLLAEGLITRGKVVLSADLQTRYVDKTGERLFGVAVGPRVSFPIHRFKLNPYAEFMIGFARYRSGTVANAQNTTDNQWQANAGLSRQLSSRLDAVADYSYSQYGANNGEYNPKSYSAGIIVHLTRR